MQVDVVTPASSLYSGTASAVYARSQEGEIGILDGHQPALLALAADSAVRVQSGGGEKTFRVSGGFLQYRDGNLSVLADGLTDDAG